MRLAYRIAAEESTDPSTQNAAVIVSNGLVVCAAANEFPAGVAESPDRWERPLKYSYVEHAERRAIFGAAKYGWRCMGTTMYVPWFACAECARGIIEAGVTEVVGHNCPLHDSRPDWLDSVKLGRAMLLEAGVNLRFISGEYGVVIRFNGKPERV